MIEQNKGGRKNVVCKYGYFDLNRHGTYVITHPEELNYPWEYIYQNRDVLLRVDQFGLVNCQAHPPHDIMLFRREQSDRYSKWNTLFRSPQFNGGIPFSGFRIQSVGIDQSLCILYQFVCYCKKYFILFVCRKISHFCFSCLRIHAKAVQHFIHVQVPFQSVR